MVNFVCFFLFYLKIFRTVMYAEAVCLYLIALLSIHVPHHKPFNSISNYNPLKHYILCIIISSSQTNLKFCIRFPYCNVEHHSRIFLDSLNHKSEIDTDECN